MANNNKRMLLYLICIYSSNYLSYYLYILFIMQKWVFLCI